MLSSSEGDAHVGAIRKGWAKSLETGRVLVLKQESNPAATGNSILRSIPAIERAETFFVSGSCNIASSLVEISGPTDEPLHFHSSHLVGLVVAGEGVFRYQQPFDPIEYRDHVTVGDIVILPRNAKHIFECEPEKKMTYVALEFSDQEIDYQKHFS